MWASDTAPAAGKVSGVIAVVVYGLYGSATGRWHMSPRIVESGTFDAFWDTVAFCFNGLVFFFAGASATNFFWRSSQVRRRGGARPDLTPCCLSTPGPASPCQLHQITCTMPLR